MSMAQGNNLEGNRSQKAACPDPRAPRASHQLTHANDGVH